MEIARAQNTGSVTAEQMAALFGNVLDPERDRGMPRRQPQRWDHVIRSVLEKIAGPRPEPWLDFGSPASRAAGLLDRVALNPQPLPPKALFLKALAQEVSSRAQLLQEVADAAEQRGIIIVGGYISRFADEFCGNGFRVPWLHPGPPPPHWFQGELEAVDLLSLAGHFAQEAGRAFSTELRQALAGAAAKFAEAGLARSQSQ